MSKNLLFDYFHSMLLSMLRKWSGVSKKGYSDFTISPKIFDQYSNLDSVADYFQSQIQVGS